jgi:hypothetical protein
LAPLISPFAYRSRCARWVNAGGEVVFIAWGAWLVRSAGGVTSFHF